MPNNSGFFFHNDNGQPTEAWKEYCRLNTRKKELQDELSLIQLRRDVYNLEQQIGLEPPCNCNRGG